jgi:peroxiredoxin
MAPNFTLPTITDDRISLGELLQHGKSVLLIFAGPNCWGCKLLLPMVRVWESDYADRLAIAVLSNGSLKDNQSKMVKYEIDRVLVDEDSAVADDYQAKWTPAAVLVHPDGRIASPNVYGDNAIREVVRDLILSDQTLPGSSNGNGPISRLPQLAVRHSTRRIGEPAPRFSLPDLSGNLVDTEDLLGNPALFIFWHPLCEFCRAMFGDLRSLEESAPSDRPTLVFIASGDVNDTKGLNKDFKSRTLLDPSFEIGPVFGTKFTPSAILIDGKGRIASSLAIGDHNVRALVGLRKPQAQLTAQVTAQV